LLTKEKDLTSLRDELNAERRNLPMVEIEKDYIFTGLNGPLRLIDMFEGRLQLIIYHFMFDPGWEDGCPSCTAGTDELSPGFFAHLHTRDTSYAMVSRAPLAKLGRWKAKKGWDIPGTPRSGPTSTTTSESRSTSRSPPASTTSAPRPSSRPWGQTTQQPDRRAALLGVATGLGFGLASAYTKGMTEQMSAGGLTAALASWQLYTAVAAGITAGWLVQNAYHAGRLAASQPGITLADPAVSIAWGIVVFGEQVRSGLFLAFTLVPLIVLVGSVFLLSRSPVLQDTAGESPGEATEDTGGQTGAKDEAA
jgi:hypothetical protein